MKKKQELESINERDEQEEVKFQIDKEAFNGPFICHKQKTILENKKVSIQGIDFAYGVWKCRTCNKEYLDSEQGKRLEKFWIMRGLLEDTLITMERTLNFDGKTYFFRFPKELTRNVHKGDTAGIKLLTADGKKFLVEIKEGRIHA